MTEKSSERVRRHRETERRHRQSVDQAYRTQLLAELGQESPSISVLSLVDIACSAYTETSVINGQFLRGNADETAMERLNSARSQLIRVLRALGLPRPPATRPVPTTIEEILAEEPDA